MNTINKIKKYQEIDEIVQELINERDLFQSFIDSLHEKVFFKDRNHRFIKVNKAKAQEQNTTPEQMIGKTDADYFSPEIAEMTIKDDEYVLKTGNPIINKIESVNTKLGVRWISVSKFPFYDEHGQIIGTMGIACDITEQKQAQEKIEHMNRVLQASWEISRLIYRVHDAKTLIDQACQLLTKYRGYENVWIVLLDEQGELIHMTISGGGEHGQQLKENFQNNKINTCFKKASQSDKIVYFEPNQEDCSDCPLFGKLPDYHEFTKRIQFSNKIYGLFSASIPVTLVKDPLEQELFVRIAEDLGQALYKLETEKQKKEAQRQFKVLFESAHDAIFIMDEQKFIDCNPVTLKIFGCQKKEDIVGKSPWQFSPELQPDGTLSIEAARQKIEKALKGTPQTFYWVHCKKDGQLFDAEVTLNRVELNNQWYLQAIVRDVSERMNALRKIEASEKKFRSIFNNVTDAIIIHDLRMNIEEVNEFAEDLFAKQRSEIIKYSFDQLLGWDEIKRNKFRQSMNRAGHFFLEWQLKTDQEPEKFIEIKSKIIDYEGKQKILTIIRDITERKKLEEQFFQAQKMESIGKLAGGVAHDFNNILTVIRGYSDLLLPKFAEDAKITKKLEQIKLAAERGSKLTNQLLVFSRKHVFKNEIINLNQVLLELKEMFVRLLGEDIRLEMELDPNLKNIMADRTQLEQVVTNLAINARDAMPEGGVLKLTTSVKFVEPKDTEGLFSLIPGEYVQLKVSDTGCGMTEEVKKCIFEPFFTTKERGKGTGLGLSTVYGVVKQYNGDIFVDSKLDKGTTFTIYLPVYETDQIDSKVTKRQEKEILQKIEGTVLLVEDDSIVRKLISTLIKSHGLKIIEAENGLHGLELFKKYKEKINLVLTDVVMPEMNGRQLYEEIIKIKPDAKVIFMSGYTDSVLDKHGILEKGLRLLQKPFSNEQLILEIQSVLYGS